MKKARIPMMIFIAVLLPVEAGAAGAGGITAPACAPGWVAPHLLQNLAPSASGFPQLTQNPAIFVPLDQRANVTKPWGARQAVSGFWFLVATTLHVRTALGCPSGRRAVTRGVQEHRCC